LHSFREEKHFGTNYLDNPSLHHTKKEQWDQESRVGCVSSERAKLFVSRTGDAGRTNS